MSFSLGEKREVGIEVLRPLHKQLREMNNGEYPWREEHEGRLWIEGMHCAGLKVGEDLQRFYQLRRTINDIKINFNEKYPTAKRLTDGECEYNHFKKEGQNK